MTNFIPVHVPDHLLGVSVLLNEQLPRHEGEYYDSGITDKFVPTQDVEKLKGSERPRVQLSKVLYDAVFLAGLGLGTAEASELRVLANEKASTAASYLNEMCRVCGVDVEVSASEYGRCAARSRTELAIAASREPDFVTAVIQVTVHDDQVYYQAGGDDGEQVVLHTPYWRWDQLERVAIALSGTAGNDSAGVLSDAVRVGVHNYYGWLPSSSQMSIEETDDVAEPILSRDEKSMRDYYTYQARTGPRLYGGAFDFVFDDSAPLRGSVSGDLESSDVGYVTVRDALGPSAEALLRACVKTVSSSGKPVGHRVVASAKEFIPRHLYGKSLEGLLAVESDEIAGLYVTSPEKHVEYYVCFIRRGRLLCARARVLKALDRSFYFKTDRVLLPGCSGGVVVDARMRAVGLVERVVSYQSGVYEGLPLDSTFQEAAADFFDSEQTCAVSSPYSVILDDDCEFVRYGVPTEGELLLTPAGVRVYGAERLANVKLSAQGVSSAGRSEEPSTYVSPDGVTHVLVGASEVRSGAAATARGAGSSTGTVGLATAGIAALGLSHPSETGARERVHRPPQGPVTHEPMSLLRGMTVDARARGYLCDRLLQVTADRARESRDHSLNEADLKRMRERDMSEFYQVLGYETRGMHVFFSMAMTHTSACAGRQTNGGLALYGDAVLRTLSVARAFWDGGKASGLQDRISAAQSNSNFASIMRSKGLDRFLLLGGGLGQVSNDKHLGTAYEALFAVLYLEDPAFAVQFAADVL